MTPAEIRAARKSLALTQGQLAAVMGLRAATVSDWERGIYPQDGSNERLLRAYLDGYRPPDWPKPPRKTRHDRRTKSERGSDDAQRDGPGL